MECDKCQSEMEAVAGKGYIGLVDNALCIFGLLIFLAGLITMISGYFLGGVVVSVLGIALGLGGKSKTLTMVCPKCRHKRKPIKL